MDRRGIIVTLMAFLLIVGSNSFAAGDSALELMPANNDVSDTESLQRGARNFMNYC